VSLNEKRVTEATQSVGKEYQSAQDTLMTYGWSISRQNYVLLIDVFSYKKGLESEVKNARSSPTRERSFA